MAAKERLRTARPRNADQLANEYPISVVIPVRNDADRFRQCLDALSGNDLTCVQVIVVDDASTDETPEIAASSPLPTEVIRLDQQAGPAAARNRGLERARCPLVFFVDSDVVLPPGAVLWIRESLELYDHRPEVAGVLGCYSDRIPYPDFLSNYKNLYTCHLYDTTDTLSPFVHTPVFCIRADLLRSVGGFDPRFPTAEDFRLGIVLGSKGYRFVIDRRIAGVHLKRYSLKSVLKEDLRRISDLRRVTFTQPEREFSYRAHRWGRLLSVATPVPLLALLLLSIWLPAFLKSAALLGLMFSLVNLRFLLFVRRKRGLWFALRAAGFLFLEMLWAQLVVIRAIFSR